MKKEYIIGIDTGGTFTDTVIVDEEGNLFEGKALTNYQDFKQGVIASFEDAMAKMEISQEEVLRNTVFVGHGTTLGTNAVIDRRLAKVGLITTKGHEDVSLIMRAWARTDGLTEAEIRHQALCRKPEPLVPKALIKGVIERVDCFGKVAIPLDRKQAKEAIAELIEDGVEAVAISLLWSFANPGHEEIIEEMILKDYPHIYVATSNGIAPRIREYARTMTVIIDACVGKLMKAYIDSLNREFMSRGLRFPISIMHAYGGVTSSQTARPVATIESGPVGGVIGSKYMAEVLGCPNVITTDVGGTSFDVSVLKDGEWSFAKEPILMRFRVAIPIIKISCIGAAGGTMAYIDPATRGLRVGPQSAGSSPGPVCYGLGGTEPTVTDADLVLGYLNPDYFFESKMSHNKDKALKAMAEKIAKPLRLDVVEAAAGIYDIINSHMGDNLRQSVIEKGYDPRDFILFAYGGNGPMHVGSYARELKVQKAYVLPQAAVFSAFGIASSDVVRVYRRSEMHLMPASPEAVTVTFEGLKATALQDMVAEGFQPEEVILQRELEMRYGRQVHEVPVVVRGGKLTSEDMSKIMDDWERRYEEVYGKGSGFREAGIQIISFQVVATAKTFKPKMKRIEESPIPDSKDVFKGKRKAFFRKYNDFVETSIYDFKRLRFGNLLKGPAIIEAPTTTIVILPDQEVRVDEYMNVIFERL